MPSVFVEVKTAGCFHHWKPHILESQFSVLGHSFQRRQKIVLKISAPLADPDLPLRSPHDIFIHYSLSFSHFLVFVCVFDSTRKNKYSDKLIPQEQPLPWFIYLLRANFDYYTFDRLTIAEWNEVI